MRITTDTKTGRLYAGPTLPQGAVLLGMVERDNLEKGALVNLASGQYAQHNAGALRTLDQGVVLRAHREAVGLRTQQALADETGASLDAVKSWEAGRRPIPAWLPRYLGRLAEARPIG